MLQLSSLLGQHPSSPLLQEYINSLASLADISHVLTPKIKIYPDAIYYNYHPLGISLLFSPKDGYKPRPESTLDDGRLVLDSIDVYNIPEKRRDQPTPAASVRVQATRTAELAFATFPLTPITLSLAPPHHSAVGSQSDTKDSEPATPARASYMTIRRDTSGKDLVATMGEPARKGGGAGPSSGSIGIWGEWTRDGVMVEFGGDEARGPQAWERGKDAVWRVLTVFVRER